jgi:Aerotolerance regulator N-terminal
MMGLSILHPSLLIAGILCVSIPILVHLLRRKHRPISWGAMRFLEQAYKKRRRLITVEQLLLLLTRCAIILCIAGAVGVLMLGSGIIDQRGRTVVFVIDNSIHSAAILDSGEPSIDYQKRRALEILQTLDPTRGDRAAVITASSNARADAYPPTSELGLIRSQIERIGSTDSQRDIDGSFALLAQVSTDPDQLSSTHVALMLSPQGWSSDTRTQGASIDRVESILIDEPKSTSHANIAITSIQPLRPMMTRSNDTSMTFSDEIQGVRIELSRSDSSRAQQSKIAFNDPQTNAQLLVQALDWKAGQSTMRQSIALSNEQINASRGGAALVQAQLLEEDSNPRDNTRTTGFPVRNHLRVGILDSYSTNDEGTIRPSRWVRAALGADQGVMSFQMIEARVAGDRIDPSLDALFILSPSSLDDRGWARVERLHSSGMPMVITPDADPRSFDWTDRLSTLAPGFIDGEIRARTSDPSIGLSPTLENQDSSDGSSVHSYLSGIVSEYPQLASSVRISRSLNLEPGPAADVLLQDSSFDPIALSWTPGIGEQPGALVLLGFAFDVRWTDLPARPLFVAMVHELLRSMLAQADTPMLITAGQSVDLGSRLEQLNGTPSEPDPRLAGVFVQVDELGSGQRGVIINPDTRNTTLQATDQATQSSAVESIASSLGDARVEQLSERTSLSGGVFEQETDPSRSISLFLFLIAGLLGIADFMLARRCSYRATVHTPHLEGDAA